MYLPLVLTPLYHQQLCLKWPLDHLHFLKLFCMYMTPFTWALIYLAFCMNINTILPMTLSLVDFCIYLSTVVRQAVYK